MEAVWGFFSVYVLTFTLMFLAVLATDLDLTTSFSAVAACINNLGRGLGGSRPPLRRHQFGRQVDPLLCYADWETGSFYALGAVQSGVLAQVISAAMAASASHR